MTFSPSCVATFKQRILPDHVDRTPVAPVADYDAWLSGESRQMQKYWSGAALRRIVVMRRRLESFSTISAAVGKRGAAAKDAFDRLPAELK